MPKQPTYRSDSTSIKVSQITSILIGRLKKFGESKGDFIERILIEKADPQELELIQKKLDERIESQKKWKAQIRQQELGFSKTQDRQLLLTYDDLTNKSVVQQEEKSIFTKDEISSYILTKMKIPINSVNLLSAEYKYLPDYIKKGQIKKVGNDVYRLESIEDVLKK